MPSGAAAPSLEPTPSPLTPLPKEGSYVHAFVKGKKISGTVISKDGDSVVISERGRFGSPELRTVSAKEAQRFLTEVIDVKPARKDAVTFVDPYRNRSLQSESRADEGQNDLDLFVKGYDAKTDMFYVQGVINGSTFGKWVSAKDAMPAIDPKTAGGDKNRGDIIKSFAGTVGMTQSLAEKFPAKPKKDEEVDKKIDNAATKDTATAPEEAKTKAGDEQEDEGNDSSDLGSDEDAPPDNVIPIIRPVALSVTPDAAPTPKNSAKKSDPQTRPGEERSSSAYVNDRIANLRAKKGANDTDVPVTESKTGTASSQSARESVVLTDATLMAPELLPMAIRQYANAAGGSALGIDAATWTQALQQAEQVSQQLNFRIQEREQQHQQLLRIEAPPELLVESESRLGGLKQAQLLTGNTIQVAQSHHSASELAAFQSARRTNSSSGDSLGDARQVQQTLNSLRAAGGGGSGGGSVARLGSNSTGPAGATAGMSQTVSIAIPVLSAATASSEIGYEQQLLQAFAAGIGDLESQLADIETQRQALEAQQRTAINDASTASGEILNGLQRLSEQQAQAEAELASLKQARTTQAARVENVIQNLGKAPTTADPSVPDAPEGSSSTPTQTRPSAVLRPGASPEQRGAPTTVLPAAEPGLVPPTILPTNSKGPRIGQPVPLSTAPLANEGPIGRRPKQETSVLGGKSNQAGGSSIRALRPLGAMGEFAALQSAQQQDRRSRDSDADDYKRPAVTDVPQKKWGRTAGEEGSEDEGDDEAQGDERPSMDEQNAEANQNIAQLQGNGYDENGEPYGDGGQDGSSSSAAGQPTGAGMREAASGPQTDAQRSSGMLGEWLNNRNGGAKDTSIPNQSVSEAKKKKMQAERLAVVRGEMKNKMIDVTGLAGFETILPVITYISRVFIISVNRRAGFMSMKMLPGYRPNLPKGVAPSSLEQSWNLALDFELYTALIGLFVVFMVVIGVAAFMFFYYFGPVLAVISAFCGYFGGVCRAVTAAVTH